MDRKIEDSRDHMRREMEFLYTRNIHALNVRNLSSSSLGSFSVAAFFAVQDVTYDTFSPFFFIRRKQILISQPRMKNHPAPQQREIWTTTKSCSCKQSRNWNSK